MGKRRTEEEIRNLYQGYVDIKQSFQDFAKKEKVDKDILRRDFTSLNLPLHPHGDLKLKLSEEKAKEIHSLYLGGQSIDEVAALVSIDRSSILRTFKRLSLSLKGVKQQKLEKRQRTLKTTKERYGVDNVAQTTEAREKLKKSLSEVDWVNVSLKRKETCLESYGVVNPSQVEEFKSKKITTSLANHGTDYYVQSVQGRAALRSTKLKKRLDILLPLIEKEGYFIQEVYTGQYIRFNKSPIGYKRYKIRHSCGEEFFDDVAVMPRCPKCFPYGVSMGEKYISDFLKSLGEEVSENNRSVIYNEQTKRYREIDILLPKRQIAFEYNGIVYHCGKDKGYHADKTEKCLSEGILLYHIWEHHNLEIIKSRLKVMLGHGVRIHARKTSVEKLDHESSTLFFTKNHLSGSTPNFLSLGLKKDGQIVAAVSFRKLKDHDNVVELARFASATDISVSGGFSKLLHAALPLLRKEYCSLVTYADRDWSPSWDNTVYAKTGFTLLGNTGPSLFYFNQSKGTVHARQTYQKYKLETMFPDVFNEDLTEVQILSLKKIYPLWTSGNWKFQLHLI